MKYIFTFFWCFIVINAFAQEPKLILPIGHTLELHSACFSPNGKSIVTAGVDNSPKIWESETGILLGDLKGHTGTVLSGQFSPDGKRILTISSDKTARIWDATTCKNLLQLNGHRLWLFSAEYSNDGTKIFTASKDSTVRVWDATTGNLILNLNSNGLAKFSPDGKEIVIITWDNKVQFWSIKQKKVIRTLNSQINLITSLDISPDGKKIIIGSLDGASKIWDYKKGELIFSLSGHTNSVVFSKFSPNSQKIVSISMDSTVKVWQVYSGKLLFDTKIKAKKIRGVEFLADNNRIVVFLDKVTRVYDTDKNNLLAELKGYKSWVGPSQVSKDGKWIVTCSSDKTAKVWDLHNYQLKTTLTGRTSGIHAAFFSPSNSEIITSSYDNTAKIWDFREGKLVDIITGHSFEVSMAKFSPSGAKVVTASYDNTATVWDVKSKRLLLKLNHSSYLTSATFSPDEKYIATTSDDQSAKIWDSKTGSELLNLKGHGSLVWTAQFSPDSKKVITASQDSIAKIWSLENGELVNELRGHSRGITGANYSSDGKLIVTSSWDNCGKVWDSATGKVLLNLKGHQSGLKSAEFSPDDKRIITASLDGTAKIWDSKTGNLVMSLEGHEEGIFNANFSTDGKYVVTASWDHTCKIWNSSTGEILYTFFAVDSTDYLVVDKFNRYDGSEGARKLLYFTCGMEVISLDQVKDQLWVPGLAERILKGEVINAPKLSELNICGLTPEVEKTKSLKEGYQFKVKPRRGGLGETVLYVNGIEIKRYQPKQLKRKKNSYELKVSEKELAPYFMAGNENPVTVKAFTAKNDVSSRGAQVVNEAISIPFVAPNLYAVMVGVSDYKGEEMDLKYAAKDAGDFSAALGVSARKLLNTDGKEHVFLYNLTTDKGHTLLPEKNSVRKTFEEIGRKATANDILLVFFAGHGLTQGAKKQFYFLTADASISSAADAPEAVGISTQELTEWMKPDHLKAQKRILILDACNSGQAINELVKIGQQNQNYIAARSDDQAQQIKAIEKLNEHSGMFILSASASNQSAYEMSRYSQGLLTYALLKAMKEQPDILEDNKYLNVSRWFGAAEKTVSDIVRENGQRQQPQVVSAGNFNVGVVDQEVTAAIGLPQAKIVFTTSNFQNKEESVGGDDLNLTNLLNLQLNNISSRGENIAFNIFVPQQSSDVYALAGNYVTTGPAITVWVNIWQNGKNIHRFLVKGKISNLTELRNTIIQKATTWVLDSK